MAREKSINVTKIDAKGEQTTYTYVNKLAPRQNLASCVTQEHYNIRNILGHMDGDRVSFNPVFEQRYGKVLNEITDSQHFHIWRDEATNTTYCTRIKQ